MDYLSEIIAQAVWLRRVENGLAKEIEIIFAEEIKLSLSNTTTAVARYTETVQRKIGKLYTRLSETETQAIISIAEKSSERIITSMEASAGKASAVQGISRDRLSEILVTDSIEGRSVSDWRKINELRFHQRLREQTAKGLEAGENLVQLKERLREKVFKQSIRNEQVLARTAANNLSNAAIWEAAESSGLSRGYRLKVTLDGRTSKICLSFAATPAKIYTYSGASPRPPFHMLCRTILMPAIIGKEHEDIPPDGDKWFASLSQKEQNEILGPERAQLFRRGRIGLVDLVRIDQTIATVAELKGVAAMFAVN